MENTPEFTVIDAYRYGWRTTLAHFNLILKLLWPFILAFVINIFLPPLLGWEAKSAGAEMLNSAVQMIYTLTTLTMTALAFCLYDGRQQEAETLTWSSGWAYFLPTIKASILPGLKILAGLLLFIIPGVIFALQSAFIPTIIVDKNPGSKEAVRLSKELAAGHMADLAKMGLAALLVMFLGVVTLGIGLIVAMPLISFAFVYFYRSLSPVETAPSPVLPQTPVPTVPSAPIPTTL